MEMYYCNTETSFQILLTHKKFSITLNLIKQNLDKEFYCILKSIDQIDRNVFLNVQADTPIQMHLIKPAFFMLLKFYFRNIKKKDGL